MAKVDLHTHTRFFHSFTGRRSWFDETGARLLVATARSRGLDAIAVTNHDYHTEFDFDTGSLTILPGIEVSSTDGHLLVVGPDPPEWTNPGEMTPGEVVDLAHRGECAVIMAHPFRNSRIREMDVAVDAVEVNGKESRAPELVPDLAAERGLPLVGGSDAHFPNEVGRTFTTVDADQVTPETMVEAIKDDRTGFRVVERPQDRYLRRIYDIIHRLRGHTASRARTSVTGSD